MEQLKLPLKFKKKRSPFDIDIEFDEWLERYQRDLERYNRMMRAQSEALDRAGMQRAYYGRSTATGRIRIRRPVRWGRWNDDV